MGVHIDGGQPGVIRLTLGIVGAEYPVPKGRVKMGVYGGRTQHVRFRNLGTGAVRIYFDKADLDGDTGNYLSLADNEIVSEDMEIDRVWMKAESGTPTVEFLVLYKRG